jgi:hypothetical protein
LASSRRDVSLLRGLENAFRVFISQLLIRKEAIRNLLRELLAISKEWNLKEKVWALEVPPGQAVKAFKAMDSPQKLFNDIPLSAMGNRMLVDRA